VCCASRPTSYRSLMRSQPCQLLTKVASEQHDKAPVHRSSAFLESADECAIPLLASAVSLVVSPALGDDASTGIASFYSARPHKGERMTAAHRSLPFGTKLRVRRVDNGKHVIVRINDRGPFIKGRIVDLSVHAARELDMIGRGLARVEVEVVSE
jgi:rare lipoprotein A